MLVQVIRLGLVKLTGQIQLNQLILIIIQYPEIRHYWQVKIMVTYLVLMEVINKLRLLYLTLLTT